MQWIHSILNKLAEPFKDNIEGSAQELSYETRSTSIFGKGNLYRSHESPHYFQQRSRFQESNMAASTVSAASAVPAVPAVFAVSALPENATHRVADTFYLKLLDMNSPSLNQLKISDYPKWARKLLHFERCRRKENDGRPSQLTKIERKAIVSSHIAYLNPPSGTTASVKQVPSAIKVEEPNFHSTMWPEDASDNVVIKFNRDLVAMSTVDLNQLNHSNYPKWARREIDRERYQRKCHVGVVDQSSNKDQKRAIPIGMGQPSPQENHVSLAAKKPSPREEIDADFLHKALAAKATYSLTYDKSLTDRVKTQYSKYGSRSIFAMFFCTKTCRHRWRSGKVAAELWLRVDTGRYRVVLHSQRCQRCDRYAEPDIEVEAYVLKVIKAFDLWKGLRDSEVGDPHHKSTAPHDFDRCHGCEEGICPKLLDLLKSLDDLPYLLETKGTSYPILFRLLNTKPHVFTLYPNLLRFLKKNRDVFKARGWN